jgi:glycosyltransferase involved in cell wall biosynthesis
MLSDPGAPTLSYPNDLSVDQFNPDRMALRVAVVTETYPPEINGVALTLQRLVEHMQARGHTLQLVRPRQSRAEPLGLMPGVAGAGAASQDMEQVLCRGLPIPRYPHLRMGLPQLRPLARLWSLQRPDLVHIATEGPLGWSALRVARRLRLPVSTDFRTNFHAYSEHYGLGWLHRPVAAYLRKFHNSADCTMVPSLDLQATLAQQGFERLHVVQRGIDTAQFSPTLRSEALRAQWGVQPHDLVALYVGRLAPEKNLDLLVRSWRAMAEVRPGTRLVVVGDGPSAQALQAQCPEALLLGARRGAELAACYASADVFVFPSVTETYGNVVPEAMASGLAVMAFNYAAAASLVEHGENGWLAPWPTAQRQAAEEEAFVAGARLLAQQPVLVAGLRAHARAATLPRQWSQIAAQVEVLWLDLLELHARQTNQIQLVRPPVQAGAGG